MRTGSPRRGQVIRRNKSAPQPLGRRRTGSRLILTALVAAGLSMALAGPALAAGPPTVTNVEPNTGPAAGGTTVTITGTNFTGAEFVRFGGEAKAASFTVNSETSITAVSTELPPLSRSAKVAVTVTTPAGTSPETSAAKFVYHPAVSEVRPVSGPPAGGTSVMITGRGFKGTSLPEEAEHGFWVCCVFFGANEVLYQKIGESPFGETLTATSPAGTGTVDVTVKTQGGTSPITSADKFTYTQAVTQHWYTNSAKATEGEEIPIVTFGNEVNVSQNAPLGAINCKGVGGGVIDNPAGGGAGEGKSNSSSFYECKAEACEKAMLEKFGVPGRGTITAENNPAATKEPVFPGWTNVLEESTVAGVTSIREKIGEPFVTFKEHSPPGMISERVDCTIAPTGQVASEALAEGELKPEIGAAKTGNLNGTSAGVPSQLKFNGASTGGLNGGAGTFSGNLKYLGYNHQELITVKP